jgi:hypothetical protein
MEDTMAQATPGYSRFHNLSNEALADAIGQADAVLKGAEAEVKALKDEFKSRGLLTAAGEHFTVTRSDQVSSRPLCLFRPRMDDAAMNPPRFVLNSHIGWVL